MYKYFSTYAFPAPFVISSTRIVPSATPSLINYVPSSIGGGFQSRFEDSTTDLSTAKSFSVVHNADEYRADKQDARCEELWRAFRDEAGPWMTRRFTVEEWNVLHLEKTKEVDKHLDEVDKDGFDGHLTQEMIASGLSALDKCPVFHHYSYIKCELNKKRLANIDALESYHYLQYVDVSGNKLTTLKPLGNLPFLKCLDASHNSLTKILDFKAPYFLTLVNQSHNKIKFMKDLSKFWSITDLNLSHNAIRVIDGLSKLKYLTALNLSYNRIETIENLNDLRIQFLYLQNNQIKSFEDDEKAMLHTLNHIRTINLSYNQVSSLKMFESVENLEGLEIFYNHISQLLDIYYLRNLKYLNKLNLMGNSVTQLRRYVEVCITNIRNLVYLDGEHINSDFWLQKLSNRATDVHQIAAHQRLKLLILEQLNKPQMWDWLLPYDTQPLAIIVLVGLQASRRAYIAKKFCKVNEKVVLGIPYTTRTKHGDETEGDLFYYVDEERFRTMLKEGKFLTYQEHLGFYYGFAHSEFRKAQDGILLFYADLIMALSLKSRFLNTKLVLTLPSTRSVHLDNLTKLYAIRLVDSGTMKIINSPQAVKHFETEFNRQKRKLLERDIRVIVEDLVNKVSTQTCLAGDELANSICQIWSAPLVQSHRRLSHRIQPMDPIFYDAAATPYNSVYNLQKPDLLSKFVSFTGDKTTQGSNDDRNNLTEGNVVNPDDCQQHKAFEEGIRGALNSQEGFKPGPSNFRSWLADVSTGDDLARVRSIPSRPWNFFVRHLKYSDIVVDDERVQAIFTGELNRREELLDLHWATPGLFRELLFIDHEEETMHKLQQLVKELTKFSGSKTQSMFNFENDPCVKALTKMKLGNCFKNLERELSISEKQAAEFSMEVNSHICGGTDCKNPACPSFDQYQ